MKNGKEAVILGLGYWGRKVLDEYIKLLDSDHLKRLYVFDTDEKLSNFNDNRIKKIKSLNEIPKEVKYAHVCTPNNSHFEVVKTLLEMGVNTLVEKPITENPDEAGELLNISNRRSTLLKVGMVYRFSKAVEKTKNSLYDSVGTPNIIYANWLHNIEVPNIVRVMNERDVVWDIGIHLLDIINYLYEDWPNFQYSKGIKSSSGLNSTFISVGELHNASVVMRSSFISHFKERRIEIIGEKGNVILDILKNTVTIGNDDSHTVFSYYDNPLLNEIKSFINDDINEDKRNDAEVGVAEVNILDQLLKSAHYNLSAVGN